MRILSTEEEQGLTDFYNEEINNETLDYYCKKSAWTSEEAAALMLGKFPERLNTDHIEQLCNYYDTYNIKCPFFSLIKKYAEYCELIECAKQNYEIARNITQIRTDTIPPLHCINWAKTKYIKLPKGLEILIRKYNPSKNTNLEALYKESLSTIERLEAENAELIKKADENIHPQRLVSWQRYSIGVTALAYGFDNILNNKVSRSRIARDLERMNVPMDDETIKELNEESIHHLGTNKYLPSK